MTILISIISVALIMLSLGVQGYIQVKKYNSNFCDKSGKYNLSLPYIFLHDSYGDSLEILMIFFPLILYPIFLAKRIAHAQSDKIKIKKAIKALKDDLDNLSVSSDRYENYLHETTSLINKLERLKFPESNYNEFARLNFNKSRKLSFAEC